MSSVASVTAVTPITKPMLGQPVTDCKTLKYPLGATFKVDGIRALKVNGEMKSRSMKPIRNHRINELLSKFLPEGADGEIVVGSDFSTTSANVMSIIGSDNFDCQFVYYWFDWVTDLKEPYSARVQRIPDYIKSHAVPKQLRIVPLIPKIVNNECELLDFETKALAQDFEGVILRRMNSPYKCGKSTLKESYMLKVKRYEDAEAVVTGFERLYHNHNEATLDERGQTKRSHKKANMIASETLGAFHVTNLTESNSVDVGVEFKIGTGMTEEQRTQFWNQRDHLLGKIVKYKYFPVGVKCAPRHPVFLGFRDPDDMDALP